MPKHDLPLNEFIRLQIKNSGPMSLATYMRLCLTHPTLGYYKSSAPIGTKGDFITAPEISQLFGEMLGTWVLMQWHNLGQPEKFDLVELGPGRGTLMADVVRVLSTDKKACRALNIVLLETNPVLRQAQKTKLAPHKPVWISEIDQLEQASHPLIILANEFFDALPIKQFQFQNGNWHERMIGTKEDQLAWGLSPSPMPASAIPSSGAQEGDIFEVSSLSEQVMEQTGALLHRRTGLMMVIDYGYDHPGKTSTFQAVADHEFADPLENPGKADLSALVDFAALREASRNGGSPAVLAGTQKQLLEQLGINARAQKLMEKNPDRAKEINTGLVRLIDPEQMGELFKVLISFSCPVPPFGQGENLAEQASISHGFFGKAGGVSKPPFSGLNVSTSVGDNRETVNNNRAIAAHALGINPQKLITLNQIHSATALIVDENHNPQDRPDADGLVTSTPHLGLGILTADCTPVLFADPEAKVIGACHAGWQGAVDGIIGNTITKMVKLGANPKHIQAAIGPTIWQHNYEVGSDWAKTFLSKHPDKHAFLTKMGQNQTEHFDLPGFVHAQLQQNGITNITQTPKCTYEFSDTYFSHRRATHEGRKTGRQISIIALK